MEGDTTTPSRVTISPPTDEKVNKLSNEAEDVKTSPLKEPEVVQSHENSLPVPPQPPVDTPFHFSPPFRQTQTVALDYFDPEALPTLQRIASVLSSTAASTAPPRSDEKFQPLSALKPDLDNFDLHEHLGNVIKARQENNLLDRDSGVVWKDLNVIGTGS